VLSAALVTGILYLWQNEPPKKCLVYAIPLSIMSSSIIFPSIHPLTDAKKKFLIYEASFSDILGIVGFNYFVAAEVMIWKSPGIFGGNIFYPFCFP
jgi:hypothetical protein